MTEATIKVNGMTCANCVKSISNKLRAIAGVDKIDISLEGKTVSVNYDEKKVTPDILKNAIDDLGFEVMA